MASEIIPSVCPGPTAPHIKLSKKSKSVETVNVPSVSVAQKPPKETAAKTGKANKKAPRRKSNQSKEPSTDMHTEMQVNENIKKLRERTKHVKTKLTKIKQTFPQQKSNKKSLSREDKLVQAIKKLKLNDVKHKTVQESSRKTSDNSDQAEEVRKNDQGKDVESTAKSLSKSQRKHCQKTKERVKSNLADDQDKLHGNYAKHINRIVSGTNSDLNLKYVYGDNLEEFAQKCVEAGLGCIVEGEVRVNAKNNHQSFITVDEGSDGMISSMAARLYAMEGDKVRVFVRKQIEKANTVQCEAEEPVDDRVDITTDEGENINQNEVDILENADPILSTRREAFVISIVERIANREFVGTITFKNPFQFDSCDYYKFRPRDMKVPMIYIPAESCKEIVDNQKPEDMMGLLYVAEITTIKDNGRCIGALKEPVGKCGNLESEVKAILLHNGMKDIKPYDDRFDHLFSSPIEINYNNLGGRIDLRDECIFTIDPLTARDLDDAMSCKNLDDGYYEIGVHISDVTAYLKESSELDEIVKLRATSIYLANEVIHMLPMSLCRKCSLLPGEDKFAFSVFWVMDEQGEIKSTRFAKSVIRSCTQFAYEHAQKIIDNPQEQFTIDDFPTICDKFSVNDIVQRVLTMNRIAENMRKRRYLNGCLSIDNPEFYFQFDPKTGEPISFETATRLSANFLIEEFMLQANQSVAQFIYTRFPDKAFLRNHQPPKQNAINNLKTKLSAIGIELNMDSSRAIHEGMKKICEASPDPEVMSAGLSYLLTKPMLRSKYFCSSAESTPVDLFHYALAVPIYTHFTSPIRRYPDVIVHRLLAAALDYEPAPKRTADELNVLAKICNDQKFNAKNASDESANLFFSRYVKANTSVKLRAVVTDIYRHSVEVITLKTGRLITLQFKMQKVIIDASAAPSVIYISEKNSKKTPMALRIFSPVDIVLVVIDDKLTGFFESPDPEQRLKNYKNESQNKTKKNRKARKSKHENTNGDH